ncbi:MAG: DUF1566 domain-containing protein [Gammaproteobacteria bacterium]|nr:DUF1566 domain-containing protein [Gammaproteobacteria bacterium]
MKPLYPYSIASTLLLLSASAFAGNLAAPAGPDNAGSAMYSLQDVCRRLENGTAGSKRSGIFTEPSAAPGSTGCSVNDIMNKAPTVDETNGVAPAEVMTGKKFWGLKSGNWGIQTGAVAAGADIDGPNGQKTVTIPDGLYSGSKTATANDLNLVPANLRSGVTIFGVTGDSNVVNTASGDAGAGDILNGKKAWADGSEVTGTFAPDTYAPETGTAVAADVLSGKTFFSASASGSGTGTMTNAGAQSITPGTEIQKITQGYHNGSGQVAGDENLVPGNIKAGMTLFGVTGSVTEATGTAAASNVLSGQTFSNASGAGIAGTMINADAQSITPGTDAQAITQGYHNGSGKVAGDANLVAGNIKSGVTIFGVSGTYPVSAVAKSGQTTSHRTGDNADLNKGAAWPDPRFTDNGNGSITDNLTGLIWTKDANCPNGTKDWEEAIDYANALANGSCSLSDGSSAGDWRLPNRKELFSLIDDSASGMPAGHPFSNVQTDWYWSSTTAAGYPWLVLFNTGEVDDGFVSSNYYVWPVRGGQ